jgi:hypothetical protein
MTDEVFSSREYDLGVVMDYQSCDPKQRIVKIQASLEDAYASLRVVVNIGYSGELKFEDQTLLEDGDRIFAEPDGLTILKPEASTDQIEQINGETVLIGIYTGGSLILFPTVEP